MIHSTVFRPSLRICRKRFRLRNPGDAILNPDVVLWFDERWIVQCADRDVDFIGIRAHQKRERGAALGAKGTKSSGPVQFSRLPGDEAQLLPLERGPSDECRATAAPTIEAMAVSNVVRRSAGFITNGTAEASAGKGLRIHGSSSHDFAMVRKTRPASIKARAEAR
jgi:hypothetical protein